MSDHIVENKEQEYVTFEFRPWTYTENIQNRGVKNISNVNDFAWHDDSAEGSNARSAMEYMFYHNYLIELYGEPTYAYQGDDITLGMLIEKHAERFTYKSGYYPIEIWETATTYISLTRGAHC